MQTSKVVIIGCGIAGMTAAIYLKRGGIEPLIIESNAPGGKLGIIPNIENYPGYENISGPDLAMHIYNQVNNLNIKCIFKNIKKVDLDKKIIDNEIKFEYLIIATGRRPKLLNLANEDKMLGKGISTCALCDGTFYKGKNVIVVGGATSALTESLYLSTICHKVTIILRRKHFTGEKYLIEKVLKTKNIKVIYNSNITNYNIKNNKLESVTLDSNKKIKADGIFLALGGIPNSDLFDLEKESDYIITDNKYETSIKNVFAVGDVIKKDYYQLINAASEGMVAASSIIEREKY